MTGLILGKSRDFSLQHQVWLHHLSCAVNIRVSAPAAKQPEL
jgi:hypothetical protein